MLYIEIKPYGVIYLLKNKINGKIYIGQTIDFNRRMNEHKNRKPSLSKKYNYHITKIINNYGFNNFSSEIIDVAYSKKDLDKKEKYYINLYKSNDPKIGYNSRSGSLKEPLNKKTRKLMTKSHKGLKETAETKRKKSNKIIAFGETKCYICDSAKIFGDFVDMSKDKVKNALRMPCKIKGYYVFYLDEDKRKEIYLKSKNEKYYKFYDLIRKGVEAIEKLYTIEYIEYN